MAYLILFTILIAIHNVTPAVLSKAHPMSALLQNILNPANSDRARQILQLTGTVNKVPSNPVLNLLQEVAVPRTNQIVYQEKQVPVQQIQEIVPRSNQVIYQEKQILPVQYQELFAQKPCASRPIQESVYPYSTPVPLVNPFLPAASPVSAMAPPTSSLLPAVNPTQVRSHFLRKIPIPPPSL